MKKEVISYSFSEEFLGCESMKELSLKIVSVVLQSDVNLVDARAKIAVGDRLYFKKRHNVWVLQGFLCAETMQVLS